MRIKFIKRHPVIHYNPNHKPGQEELPPRYRGIVAFSNAPIKAMNLIMQGYAELYHSCHKCNPFHIYPTKESYGKPFKLNPDWEQSFPCVGKNGKGKGFDIAYREGHPVAYMSKETLREKSKIIKRSEEDRRWPDQRRNSTERRRSPELIEVMGQFDEFINWVKTKKGESK